MYGISGINLLLNVLWIQNVIYFDGDSVCSNNVAHAYMQFIRGKDDHVNANSPSGTFPEMRNYRFGILKTTLTCMIKRKQ